MNDKAPDQDMYVRIAYTEWVLLPAQDQTIIREQVKKGKLDFVWSALKKHGYAFVSHPATNFLMGLSGFALAVYEALK